MIASADGSKEYGGTDISFLNTAADFVKGLGLSLVNNIAGNSLPMRIIKNFFPFEPLADWNSRGGINFRPLFLS